MPIDFSVADDFKRIDLIISDEMIMGRRYGLEVADKTQRDIARCNLPFG